MGIFDALNRARSGARGADDARRLAAAWGLDEAEVHPAQTSDEDQPAPALSPSAPVETEASAYDRSQWLRKLKRVLDELPDSEAEWEPMETEGKALKLGDSWMRMAAIEEFTLMVRRAVADRVFTRREHEKIEHARRVIGLSEREAEAIVDGVIREAEQFFGGAIEGA
jgi:hypothetical protein